MKAKAKALTASLLALLLLTSAMLTAAPAVQAAGKTLTLSAKSLYISVDDTVDLNSYYSDNSDCSNIAYYSSNPSVADVKLGGGLVTALRSGTAKITAKDLKSGHTAYCSVTVSDDYTEVTTETATARWHKGTKGYCEVLGINPDTLLKWMGSHDNKGSDSNDYYVGTPFHLDDYRKPNGDKSDRYATGNYGLPTWEPKMNCTGFVWHMLQSVSSRPYDIPAESGWVSLYLNKDISRYIFPTRGEMLNSGLLEKGDIIWQFCTESEYYGSEYNHIGFYYGNGTSDVFWHSAGSYNDITNVRGCGRPLTFCVVLKAKPYNQVKFNRNSLSLGQNEGYGLVCDKTGVTWKSSNTKVATVDSKGYVKGVSAGSATITASKSGYHSATCSVTVKSAPESVRLSISNRTMGVGETFTISEYTNSGSYANAANLRWSSSNTSVATVTKIQTTNQATITAKAPGTADISIKTYNGKTASARITVKKAPSKLYLNAYSVILGRGETFDFNSSVPSDEHTNSVAYTSSNTGIVSVKKAGGLATGNATGTAKVYAKTYNGKTATANVTVKQAPSSVALSVSSCTVGVGESFVISEKTPSGTYANAANLRWTSSNNSVASVTKGEGNKAVVRAAGEGTAVIKIQLYNGKYATATVRVKSAPQSMRLSIGDTDMGKGEKLTVYEVTNSGSYASAPTIKWSSSDSSVVSVKKGDANKAELTAVSNGTAVITATAYNGVSASVTITVKDAPKAVNLSPGNLTLERGKSYSFTDVIPEAQACASLTYKSGNVKTATVSAGGTVTAVKEGRAVITVTTYNGLSATCVVNVVAPKTQASVAAAAEKATAPRTAEAAAEPVTEAAEATETVETTETTQGEDLI